jgi:hypothetical protein
MPQDFMRLEIIKRKEQEAEMERSRYQSELEFTVETALKELALLTELEAVRKYIEELKEKIIAF